MIGNLHGVFVRTSSACVLAAESITITALPFVRLHSELSELKRPVCCLNKANVDRHNHASVFVECNQKQVLLRGCVSSCERMCLCVGGGGVP